MEKTEVVRMRVTPEQRDTIKAAATAAGLSMSAYMLYKLGVSAGEALGDAIIKAKKSKKS